jgi:hypothetical protein
MGMGYHLHIHPTINYTRPLQVFLTRHTPGPQTSLPRHGRQMPILVIPRLEKRITQRNRLDALHVRIHDKLWIDVEKHGHIDRLAGIQPLLLEAEALDLAEVRRHLARGHAVRRHADDVLGGLVGRRVEGECGLARQHPDFALLRREFPGEHVGYRAVEGYAQAGVVLDGAEALGGVARVVAVGGGFDGLAAPAGLLADLGKLERGMAGSKGESDHFVHGHGAVGYCDEADNNAINVVAMLCEEQAL